jgi:hypothetical protein
MTKGAACAFNDIHRSRRICDFASLPLDGLRSMGSPPRSFARGVNLFGERHLRHVPLSHIDYLMARALTYRRTRTRRYHVPPRQQDAFCPVRSWADGITNMLGLDLR